MTTSDVRFTSLTQCSLAWNRRNDILARLVALHRLGIPRGSQPLGTGQLRENPLIGIESPCLRWQPGSPSPGQPTPLPPGLTPGGSTVYSTGRRAVSSAGVNNIDYRHLFTFSNNRTRSNGWKLELKRFNTSQCGNFITYKIAPIWNRLPAEAVNSARVEQFKIELDKVIVTLI